MSFMFWNDMNLTSIDVSGFEIPKVTNMDSMFAYMYKLTSLNLSKFNTSNVTNMTKLFLKNSKLTTVTYGTNFIRKSDSTITDMFTECPANKPTHSSWSGAF